MRKKILSFLIYFFPSLRIFLFSTTIGVSFALAIYLGLFQRSYISIRFISLSILIWIFFTFLFGWFISTYLLKFLTSEKKASIIVLIVSSLILTTFLMLNIQLKPAHFLLGKSNLEIGLENINEEVTFSWIKTEFGYVSYSSLDIEGEWHRESDAIQIPPQSHLLISWTGYAGDFVEVAFQGTQEDQFAVVNLNNTFNEKNLQKEESRIVLIQQKIDIPSYAFVPMIFSLLVSGFAFFVILIVILSELQIDIQHESKKNIYSWLLYGLPVFLSSIFMLLIFWPGFFTNDSLWMWNQAATKTFSSWQSTFYEYVISLFVNNNNGVTIMLVLQVVIISFIAAWSLRILERIGISKFVLWIVAFLMAIFPMNNLYFITLWKDIPYAIFFLAFTTLVLQITISDGHWVTIRKNWVYLVLTGFLVSALRHNGWPSIIATLSILIILYRKFWRIYLKVLLLVIIAVLILQTPHIFTKSGDKQETGQVNLVLLHHIAAHVNSGTKLIQTEVDYLNDFLPLDEWDYDPCYVGTISYNRDFGRNSFLSSTPQNLRLASALFLRNPIVDASHMLKSGELAYKFTNTACSMKSLHGFNNIVAGEVDWVVKNDYGIDNNSQIPGFIQPILKYYNQFGIFDGKVNFYLYPAFWLIISILSITIAAIRMRKIEMILVVLPVVIQSLVLFLIGFAPAYRYYYSNCLVGIVICALCFVTKIQTKAKEIDQ